MLGLPLFRIGSQCIISAESDVCFMGGSGNILLMETSPAPDARFDEKIGLVKHKTLRLAKEDVAGVEYGNERVLVLIARTSEFVEVPQVIC